LRARDASGRAAVIFAALAGLSGGIALAVRPQLLLNVAIAAFVVLSRRGLRVRLAVAAGLGLLIPVASVLALNTAAAGRFVGFSENGGMNFFQGHCPANHITAGTAGGEYDLASPVAVENDRGIDYVFPTHFAWEQSYFVRLGLQCMKERPAWQIAVIARNVADLGITSVPFPQAGEKTMRLFVKPTNLVYSVALPSILVASMFLALGKEPRRYREGEWILIVSLLAVLPTAVIFYGDPRFRVPYDVFGLALVASLISAWLDHRDARSSRGSEVPTGRQPEDAE
jgi:hypothetical protein